MHYPFTPDEIRDLLDAVTETRGHVMRDLSAGLGDTYERHAWEEYAARLEALKEKLRRLG